MTNPTPDRPPERGWRARRRARTVARLERLYAGEPQVRRELRIILAPLMHRLGVALAGLAAVIVLAFYVPIEANRRQDADRLAIDIAGCARGNITRADINQLNDAVDAVAAAVAANSTAVDTMADAIIAAVRGLDDDGVLRPEVDAALAGFRDTVADATDIGEQQLAVARQRLADARLAFRDCSAIADGNPDATIPPPVTTGDTAPVGTDVEADG